MRPSAFACEYRPPFPSPPRPCGFGGVHAPCGGALAASVAEPPSAGFVPGEREAARWRARSRTLSPPSRAVSSSSDSDAQTAAIARGERHGAGPHHAAAAFPEAHASSSHRQRSPSPSPPARAPPPPPPSPPASWYRFGPPAAPEGMPLWARDATAASAGRRASPSPRRHSSSVSSSPCRRSRSRSRSRNALDDVSRSPPPRRAAAPPPLPPLRRGRVARYVMGARYGFIVDADAPDGPDVFANWHSLADGVKEAEAMRPGGWVTFRVGSRLVNGVMKLHAYDVAPDERSGSPAAAALPTPPQRLSAAAAPPAKAAARQRRCSSPPAAANQPRQRGVVVSVGAKNYAWVQPDCGGTHVFLHLSQLESADGSAIPPRGLAGTRVEYSLLPSGSGGARPSAHRAVLLGASDAHSGAARGSDWSSGAAMRKPAAPTQRPRAPARW